MKVNLMNMNTDTNGCSALTKIVSASAGALLIAVSSFGVFSGTTFADPEEGRDGTQGDANGDDGFFSDDEVIGSLPMNGDKGGDDILDLLMMEEPPTFYVQGPAPALLRSIVSAGYGMLVDDAFATYEFVQTEREGLGDLRITFHGGVDLTLDASLLAVPGVEFGLTLGTSFDAYGAALVCGERMVSSMVLESSEDFSLPFAGLLDLGMLDDTQILTAGGKGLRSTIDVDEDGGLISISQSILQTR